LPSRPIPGKGTLKVTVATTGCADDRHHVKYLEHVQAVITLSFSRRGDLSIKLISPRGTVAILLAQRRQDYSSSGFTDWEFMSTHTWGEDPKGTWTLEIENHGKILELRSFRYKVILLHNEVVSLHQKVDSLQPTFCIKQCRTI